MQGCSAVLHILSTLPPIRSLFLLEFKHGQTKPKEWMNTGTQGGDMQRKFVHERRSKRADIPATHRLLH
ncbi:hypothetical protein FRC18_007249, partial [Serendipita sp. 400]